MTTLSGSPAPEFMADRVPLRRWFGIAAVAMGTFAVAALAIWSTRESRSANIAEA